MGRTCWSDVIRNSRTLSRLIWFHVPPCLTPKRPEETQSGQLQRSTEELNKVMAEKLMALDLVEG
jgi:putative membrane protein